MSDKNKDLKKLEKDIVENQDKISPAKFEEEAREVSETPFERQTGLGIEEEQEAGQEPNPEVEQAMKDPDEDDDEDKL